MFWWAVASRKLIALITNVSRIIRQPNSWAPLQVTSEDFAKLVAILEPHVFFFDVVAAFGYREDRDTRMVPGYAWKLDIDEAHEGLSFSLYCMANATTTEQE